MRLTRKGNTRRVLSLLVCLSWTNQNNAAAFRNHGTTLVPPSTRSIISRSPSSVILHESDDPTTPRPESSQFPDNDGLPSLPGWKPNQVRKLTSWSTNDVANRPIICEYEPDALWLWTRWRGTVLSLTIVPVLATMAVGILVDRVVHYEVLLELNTAPSNIQQWPLLATPPADHPVILQLAGLNSFWEYQVTLTTFILTFFTSEAYKHWRSVYFTTRAIQGRINDLCLLLTITTTTTGGIAGGTAESTTTLNNSMSAKEKELQDLVLTCTRLLKKSHSFFWAATPTVSDGLGDVGIMNDDDTNEKGPRVAQPEQVGPLLLTPEGLQGLVQSKELTPTERDALLASGLPPTQYTYVLLEWVGMMVMDALESGLLLGTGGNHNKNQNTSTRGYRSGWEDNFLRQLTALRGEYFNIGDYLSGRMPLAYVQLVQVLVDSLVLLAPIALYSDLGTLAIPLSGLLTLFYKGLLDLSKSFLDPFGVEGFPGQNIRVDVLVSELNFGAARRWTAAARAYPGRPKAGE